jgi:hypothetical protein
MTKANLAGADLTGASLRYASLSEANLSHTPRPAGCTKGAADLQGAKQFGADLRGAWLEGANLTAVWLPLASLAGARLTRVLALLGVSLLLPGAAHAAVLDQYSVQVLAQSGVQTPGFHPIGNYFAIYQMNDHGQISLVTRTQESNSHQVLGVLSNGQFTPIAAGGGP